MLTFRKKHVIDRQTWRILAIGFGLMLMFSLIAIGGLLNNASNEHEKMNDLIDFYKNQLDSQRAILKNSAESLNCALETFQMRDKAYLSDRQVAAGLLETLHGTAKELHPGVNFADYEGEFMRKGKD